MMDLAWIDIETTGLDPDQDEILQVAVILTDGRWQEQDRRCWHFFCCRPERLRADLIERGVIRYEVMAWRQAGARDDEGTDGEPCRRRGMRELAEYVADRIPAGQNVIRFDLPFVERCWRRYGIRRPWRHRAVDTCSLAATALPDAASLSLPALCEELGVELAQAHDAMADIEATLEVARRLRRRMRDGAARTT
jgi:DNA polymerase III alpha subunit (gram-positive type)